MNEKEMTICEELVVDTEFSEKIGRSLVMFSSMM